ncbi:hypothetical protein D3C87_2020090 [compost metagenome]
MPGYLATTCSSVLRAAAFWPDSSWLLATAIMASGTLGCVGLLLIMVCSTEVDPL